MFVIEQFLIKIVQLVNNLMNLYRVSVSIDSRGINIKVRPIEAKETKNSYTSEGLRIPKSDLMSIKTIFVESHTAIRYYSYCLEQDIEKTTELLKDNCFEKVKQYKAEIDELYQVIFYNKEFIDSKILHSH